MNPFSFSANSEAISRRSMLTRLASKGIGGLGSLALMQMLESEGLLSAAETSGGANLLPKKTHFPGQAKAVIQLVHTGGPSQMDLFDPKPELSRLDGKTFEGGIEALQKGSESKKLFGTPFKFKPHGECGMELSELLPHTGSIADDICLIRSQVSAHNNHTEAIIMLASGKIFPGRPTMGAWISYAMGTENQDLPAFVVLRDPDGYSTSGGLMSKSGWLPAVYAGTEFNARGTPIHNLTSANPLPAGVQHRDLELLAKLNEQHLQNHPNNTELDARIRNYELAARMQLSATDVLDLSQETEEVKKLYGLDNPTTASFGTRCLMARRLVQSGVRFVQVFSTQGQQWDHHGNLESGLKDMCAKTDLPSAGLIKDLKRRGLLDETIVIWAGEFGRLPVSQNGSGRDHNKYAGSMWMAGGGLKRGFVHGTTDELGHKVVADRFSIPDMFATVAHQLGFNHHKLTYHHAGREESISDAPITGAHVHAAMLSKPPVEL